MSLRPHRVTRRLAGVLAAVLVPAAVLAPAESAADASTGGPTAATGAGLYLVTLDGLPTGAHPDTRPAPGERHDRSRPAVRSLRERLLARQDAVLAQVGGPDTLYRFTAALNGFAARLDERQVRLLRRTAGVVLVERSVAHRPAGDTAGFLGLEGDGGAWDRPGGPDEAGDGLVVGVVDSGIWPDNPSFAGLPQERTGRSAGLPGFHGACEAGESWSTDDCSDEVVSARWFIGGFGEDRLASTEYVSPRDSTGHGSHSAATAAGVAGVRVRIDRQDFPDGSGMAPGARIAVYKACWTAPDPEDDGCTTADTVAAIDQAVADGVDVLSYAVTGSADPRDTVGRAFLGADAAGVFVAAAAGNTGPGPGSVQNAYPWVATVGASTYRARQGAVVLGNGTELVGAMSSARSVPLSRVVHARDAAAPGSSPDTSRWCEAGSLDATAVQGKVVVCDRGRLPRVDKSAGVRMAGGRAMVLVNTQPDSVEADVHSVPTVHLDADAARTLAGYLRTAGGDAAVALGADVARPARVPAIASFSARGPAADVGLLGPDLVAPGVGVVGATAPTASGRLWDVLSGTSVSTAHVAGLAAFLQGVHPSWSPQRLRSAMMTTAYGLEGSAGPFAEGAGHVDPTAFADPGLVLDAAPSSWRRYAAGDLPASRLNLPSVAVPDLVGRTTVARRLTNVGPRTETYTASATGLAGIDVRVTPATLTLRPGQTGTVRIRLTATSRASLHQYARGRLTWTGAQHRVRLPVVARPADVAAPDRVSGSGPAGRTEVRARSGSGRPLEVSTSGLVPASPVGLTLSPHSFDVASPDADADTFSSDLHVPEDTAAVRFELEAGSARDAVGLHLFRAGEPVASSSADSATARLTVMTPAPGDYTLYVHAAQAGNGSAVTGRLSTWVVPETGGTPLEVAVEEQPSRPGDAFRYSASWSDLDPTRRWLGVLRYAGTERQTLLEVN